MRLPFTRSWNLSLKFAFTITLVVAGVAFTIGAAIVAQDWRWFHDELEEKALLLSRSVAVTIPEAILRNDYWPLYKGFEKMASKLSDEEQTTRIISGMILDPKGLVIAHMKPSLHPLGLSYEPKDAEELALHDVAMSARTPIVLSGGTGREGFVEGVAPLFFDEKYLGNVRIRLSTNGIYSKTLHSAYTILGLTLAMVAVGSFLGAAVSRRMVKPLTEMTKGMEAVSRGELTNISPVQVFDDDELGKLADTFNKMAVEMAEKKALKERMLVNEKRVALGRITAGVAHEVNNPLAGLLNCIDTLKKYPDDPGIMDRYLPLLDKGLNRIRNIVESLLVELSVEDATESSDPSCLEELKDIVEAEIDGLNINFIWENHLADEVRINRRWVQQIVLNLLKNAVQVLPNGGTVTFRSFLDGGCVVLEVNDDGPGIPPEYRNQLFDPFFTTKPNGTGLGLWIVYRLVESMRGVINVESEVGSGTTFQVTLPAYGVQA